MILFSLASVKSSTLLLGVKEAIDINRYQKICCNNYNDDLISYYIMSRFLGLVIVHSSFKKNMATKRKPKRSGK